MGKLEDEINTILVNASHLDSSNPNPDYHKGGICPYKDSFLFCQEGFCEGCMIYTVWKGNKKAREEGLKGRATND